MARGFPQFVIWDWNGTLLNDAPISCQAMNLILGERRLPPVSLERYREICRHPVEGVYEDLGFNLEHENFPALAELFHANYARFVESAPLHEGVIEALDLFRSRGTVQSILSAHPHDLLMQEIRARNVEHYFRLIRGSDDRLARGKIALGVELASNYPQFVGSTLVIGDSTHDFEVSKAVNARCLLVSTGYESVARLHQSGCPVYSSLFELLHNEFTE